MPKGTGVDAHVHKIDGPEPGPLPKEVSGFLYKQQQQWLTHAEREQHCAKAQAQRFKVSVVAAQAFLAHVFRARLPQLQARLHTLQQILAKKKGNHKHNNRDHVSVLKAELHI